MSEYQDYRIYGSPFSLVLSAVDQVTPPIYSRRVLIFSRQDENPTKAISLLKSGLQRTVDQIPFLAGQMGLDTSGWTVKSGGHARLRVKKLDMSFAELKASDFSESMLLADNISSVPGLADPQEDWHVCRLQANFIRGGLLLVVSINHSVTDGYGITKITEALARNCHVDVATTPVFPGILDRSALSRRTTEPDLAKISAYSLVAGPTNLGTAPPQIVTTTFRLSPSALKPLKLAASPPESWITTHDAVNALCWRTHAQGRLEAGLLAANEQARFAFPVDFRSLTHPPLGKEYLGNAVLMTKVELPVSVLLGEKGLAAAAAAIRVGVRETNGAYVENFIAVAASLENQRQLKINLKLSMPHTGFGSTSYRAFSHAGMDWHQTIGRFERFRLSHGVTGEGMSVVLPVLEDGSWEVTVTLLEELVQRFQDNDEWKRYTSRQA